MTDKELSKAQKKRTKAEAKAVKKGLPAPKNPTAAPAPSGPIAKTPAERSAEAAEKQLALHRWKVILGALGAIIALLSLVYTFLKS